MQSNYRIFEIENKPDAPPRTSSPEAVLLRLLVPVIAELLRRNRRLDELEGRIDEMATMTGEILRLMFGRIERLEGRPASEVLQ